MSNINSAADAIYQQNQGQPIVLSFGSNPGHKAFSIGGNAVLLTVPNPLLSALSGVPFPSRSAQGLSFVLRAAGLHTLGGNEKFQIDINQGAGLSPAIITSGVITSAPGGGSDNWLLEATCLWDATSLNLRGYYEGFVGPNNVAQAAITGTAPAALANLQFNCAVTVTNANPVNQFFLTDFSVDFY